jgi:hypothetical protein
MLLANFMATDSDRNGKIEADLAEVTLFGVHE